MENENTLPDLTPDDRPFYEKWQETEGVDIIKGWYIKDLREVPLKPWKRKGGVGAFINLQGTGGENDAYVCEIPPGGSLHPQKHLFEEMIFILTGRGSTTIWQEGGKKESFEWQAGSLFSPPLNTWHQHFNVQGDKPARYLAVTLAPTVMNLFHNADFVFGNSFVFGDRYEGQRDYFSGKGRMCKTPDWGIRVWETNFISNVEKLSLIEWKERGAEGKSILFEISENSMLAHVSEFGVGMYKKAHRHHAGAHVTILNGEGYTLMWDKGKPERYDWRAGSMIVPPEMWWHQHFNVGKEPARYLALHGRMSRKHRSGQKDWKGLDKDVKEGGDQIEYEDEDPMISRMFESELEKRGAEYRMARFKK